MVTLLHQSADINECEAEEDACQGKNLQCVNTLGGFICQCLPGFAEKNGSCLGKFTFHTSTL